MPAEGKLSNIMKLNGIRPKNICVFPVSALKKIGMVGWYCYFI